MLFTYTITKQGYIHIITLQGDLIEASQASKLMQEIDDIILDHGTLFLIDMDEIKYLNSSGLTILIRILTKARKAGGEAVMACLAKRIKELMVITKLNSVFTISDNVDEGIIKLNKLASS
jgi:anti-sigma B factor antagonist